MTQPKLNFKLHLLKRRLRRLPKDLITKFLEGEQIDCSEIKSQKELIERIITEYQIQLNNLQFINKFKNFLRDEVLTAREADYLISITESQNIIKWIQSWANNNFVGQKHNFKLHTVIDLDHKFLEINPNLNDLDIDKEKFNLNKICFPTTAIFVVASSQTRKQELNGLEEISYYPTTEFEIILRKDLDIVEIRGSYKVVRDFVSTAILDKNNPLSAAKNYFIGDEEDSNKGITQITRQIIRIDTLKNLLDGSYTKLSSPFSGSKMLNIEATLDDLKTVGQETHPEAQKILTEMMKNPVKGKISFCYNRKKYSFSVTKTGGLLFREYIPEETVTYILYHILLSGYVRHGS